MLCRFMRRRCSGWRERGGAVSPGVGGRAIMRTPRISETAPRQQAPGVAVRQSFRAGRQTSGTPVNGARMRH